MFTQKNTIRRAAFAAAVAVFALTGLVSAMDYCSPCNARLVSYQTSPVVTYTTTTLPSVSMYETRAVMSQSSPDFLIPTTHGLVETRDPAQVFNNPVDNYYHTYARENNYGAGRWYGGYL
jgi:hypothetical protein